MMSSIKNKPFFVFLWVSLLDVVCLFFPLAFVALCCCCCCCLLRVFRSSLAALCSFGSLVISFTRALACNHWLFIHKVTHKDNKELAFFVRVCVSVLPCFMLCSSACSLHVFFLSFFLSFARSLSCSSHPLPSAAAPCTRACVLSFWFFVFQVDIHTGVQCQPLPCFGWLAAKVGTAASTECTLAFQNP